MDAFAVSITDGIVVGGSKKRAFQIAFTFGFAQGLMPFIGYYAGINFVHYIKQIDHWIGFGLLSIIGFKMIYDAINDIRNGENISCKTTISLKTILLQSVATSIDALAVGISFALLEVNILYAVSLIGIVTFLVCFIGVKIGKKVGHMFKEKAEIIGGIVLILIGINILIHHTIFC